jgi:hypothetical protein
MENHSFKDYEKLKLDKKAARLTKNKTYAEALSNSMLILDGRTI